MTRVAVTRALNRAALAVIRDLGRGGHEVIACDERVPPLGLHSRYCRTHLRLSGALPPSELVDRLAAAGADVLLAMTTPEVVRLSRAQATLARHFALSFPDHETVLAAYDKCRTYQLCRRLGIPVPRLVADSEARGPVIVKPRYDIGGARGVRRYADIAEARVEDPARELLCEYIPGPPDAMHAATLLFDRNSRLVAWFTLQSVRQYPITGGLAAMAVSTFEPHLVETVLPFFETVKWQGPAEVEFKIDARCGTAKVIEINPRLPGYVRYFLDCGLHLPRLVAEAACGRVTSPTGYVAGRRLVNPGVFLKHCRQLAASERAPAAAIWQACREALHARWRHPADISDPAPRIAKLLMRANGASADRSPS